MRKPDDFGRTGVKCDICGFEFECELREEPCFDDLESSVRRLYYPVGPKDNKPHLLRNYICDKCYNNLGQILLENWIEDCKKYYNNTEYLKKRWREDLDRKIEDLDIEKKEVIQIEKMLRKVDNLIDIPHSVLDEIKSKSSIFRTYYLDTALSMELKEKRGLCTCAEWAKEYGLGDHHIVWAGYINLSKKYSLNHFKNILENSVITDMTFNELNKVIATINRDLLGKYRNI